MEDRGSKIERLVLYVLLATSFLLAVVGCTGRRKIERIHVGMTVHQVEEVLGEPGEVLVYPEWPTREFRSYRGDGKYVIHVEFEEGLAKEAFENK